MENLKMAVDQESDDKSITHAGTEAVQNENSQHSEIKYVVDYYIEIVKGDPKEVLDILRKDESSVTLRPLFAGRYRQAMNYFTLLETCADYFIKPEYVAISFSGDESINHFILRLLAARFPNHEFRVVQSFGGVVSYVYQLRNGRSKRTQHLECDYHWEAKARVLALDVRWDWEGNQTYSWSNKCARQA